MPSKPKDDPEDTHVMPNRPPDHPRAHVAFVSCWCKPTLDYEDPDTRKRVWVHKG